MIDFLAFIIGFFLICVLVFLAFFGIIFLYRLLKLLFTKPNSHQEENKQTKDNLKENSQADGLVLFDDPLFPEEPDKNN